MTRKEKITILATISLIILAIVGSILYPKIDEYLYDKEQEKIELKKDKEQAFKDYKEAKEQYSSDFIELVSEGNLVLHTIPNENSDKYLSESEQKEYEKITEGLSEAENLFKDMTNIEEEFPTFEVINAPAIKDSETKEKFEQKKSEFEEKFNKFPDNQQQLFKLMIEDMETEFNFYSSIYPDYFSEYPNFFAIENDVYHIFGPNINTKLLDKSKGMTAKSPVGYAYFGLDSIEDDINRKLVSYKENSARFIDDIPKKEREEMLSVYWKDDGDRYRLYLKNNSQDYIKFAEEAFLIYYDFKYLYFHTSQFSDTRSGLDDLNRVSYGETSRNGYTWTVFTLKPDEVREIGSTKAEKFEKFSYGTLEYRYQDKTLDLGVPAMENN